MKDRYVLLNKEYSSESLYDVDRDVDECFGLFPQDEEFKSIINKDDKDFLSGSFKVLIVYVPGDTDIIK